MNKLDLIGELRRIARVIERGDKELPKKTPLILKQAAQTIEDGLKSRKAIPISELNLSAHAYNALYRRGWLTVDNIKGKSMTELLRVCGIGEKTAMEIREAVEKYKGEENEL